MANEIKLSDHFGFGKLLRFTLPSVGMMIFTSIYSIVDGLFVSNFAGKTPFAAINLIYPFLMILGTIGFMVGTGGTAIVSRLLGQGDRKKANEVFSMLVYVSIGVGVFLATVGAVCAGPIAVRLGADPEMAPWCVLYTRILMISLPALILQFIFQPFMIAAERPNLGFWITFAAGMTNIAGDALFVALLGWGLKGAAAATVLSQLVGGLVPLIYFSSPRNRTHLRLGRPSHELRYYGETCVNGSSELLSNVSQSVVSMLYNWQLMKYLGQDGVAAYGVIMYVLFIFIAVFVGYSLGVAPVIGYNYGARNHPEQANIFQRSMMLIAAGGLVMVAFAETMAGPLSHMFVGYDAQLCRLTERAFRIYCLSFLLCGFNIYGSSMFTAFSNGVISAVISFFRTLVCETGAVIILPLLFGIDGIWFAIIAAESVALCLTTFFTYRNRHKYGYV